MSYSHLRVILISSLSFLFENCFDFIKQLFETYTLFSCLAITHYTLVQQHVISYLFFRKTHTFISAMFLLLLN